MKCSRLFRAATSYQSSSKLNYFSLKRLFFLLLMTGVLTITGSVNAFSQNKTENLQSGVNGDWVADLKNDDRDKIEITFVRPSAGVPNAVGILFSFAELKGLTPDKLKSQKTEVNFSAKREAGSFTFEGYFSEGKGKGTWFFASNSSFVSAMQSHGYNSLSENDLVKAAIYNLTIEFVENLNDSSSDRLDFQDFLRARAGNVDSEYIREVNEMGFARQPLGTLIWMRSHNINRKYISELKAKGYTNLTLKKIVELRERDR
jgi:hypothetical protein